MNESLTMSRWDWRTLIADLRRRGDGQRESGAFLLAAPDSTKITQHICYDDLDPEALDTGIIVFRGLGYTRLWQLCDTKQLRVVADIHTHPGKWTGQSDADATHPMVGLPGHVALIAPYFAHNNSYTLSGVGIFRYRGDHKWQTCTARDTAFTLSLT